MICQMLSHINVKSICARFQYLIVHLGETVTSRIEEKREREPDVTSAACSSHRWSEIMHQMQGDFVPAKSSAALTFKCSKK